MREQIKYKVLFIIIVMCIMPFSLAHSKYFQKTEEVKAQFIYNFIPYFTWPSTIRTENDPLTICFLEGDITSAYFHQISQKSNHNPKINLQEKEYRDNLEDCHMLYIASSSKPYLFHLINAARKKPILTISDIPNFLEHGGILDFYFTKEKEVVLKINLSTLDAAHLKVDVDFLAITEVIR